LDEAARRAARAPKYIVSDQGSEFGEDYLEWCDDHDVRARFGAVGRHGSIAVEERFIRTLKEEGLAHEMVSLQHSGFCTSMARFEGWYNEVRPHSSMGDATPDEVFHRRRPANRRGRFEPRPRYPANGACAAPRVPARSKIGARLELVATSFRGARHLGRSKSGGQTERCGSGAFSGKGDVCLASEKSIKRRASGISETSNPRPKAFSASRFDLELRGQMSLFFIGDCRWNATWGYP